MGTSQSNPGPGKGVPMVPPWADDLPDDEAASPDDGAQPDDKPDDESQGTENKPPEKIAPPHRWTGANRNLKKYAEGGGDQKDLKRSLHHYAKTGYGGSKGAAARMNGTAKTAAALGGVLSGLAAGSTITSAGSPLDPKLLSGRTASEIMDALVETVRPVDGTQDAEAERASIRDALSELLVNYPEADLLDLTDDQRSFAIERFTAFDVFRRFDLDVGKTIREKASSASSALKLLKQARDYVKQVVAASFRKLKNDGHSLTSGKIVNVVKDALQATYEVFEGGE
ncbi:hypothetical protein AUP42_01660 [Thalassospira lucentensis]|uniref:Uncharacterized protein n=2 Tax=Thalassospira lucentensis TaxID=168935 RepID=A0A154L3S1_9PROT|nr:hypothetical protein AUP42_01660 [Thalassospira lucentensis]